MNPGGIPQEVIDMANELQDEDEREDKKCQEVEQVQQQSTVEEKETKIVTDILSEISRGGGAVGGNVEGYEGDVIDVDDDDQSIEVENIDDE